MVSSTPAAFADHTEVTIGIVEQAGVTMDCVTDGCYTPITAIVDVGGVVTMINDDTSLHTFTSGTADDFVTSPDGEFDSDVLFTGKSFEWIPDAVGVYPYYCDVHPWMNGMIIVQEVEAAEEEMEGTPEEIMKETIEGGGCLIATATFGSELAPQVQQLRELRDNTILSTESGTSFMTGFNQFYYSFSPAVADLERESPLFKEAVRLALTPMLSSLSLLNHVGIDSEEEMLGYGISLIILNLGMYVGIPAFGILKLYQFKRN